MTNKQVATQINIINSELASNIDDIPEHLISINQDIQRSGNKALSEYMSRNLVQPANAYIFNISKDIRNFITTANRYLSDVKRDVRKKMVKVDYARAQIMINAAEDSFNKGNLLKAMESLDKAFSALNRLPPSSLTKSISGVDKYLASVKSALNKIQEIYNYASIDLQHVCKSIYSLAVSSAPMHSGTLRSSCKYELFNNGFSIEFDTTYAYKVHEDMTINHPWHVHPSTGLYNCMGKAKYLESPASTFVKNPTVYKTSTGGVILYVRQILLPDGYEYISVSSEGDLY